MNPKSLRAPAIVVVLAGGLFVGWLAYKRPASSPGPLAPSPSNPPVAKPAMVAPATRTELAESPSTAPTESPPPASADATAADPAALHALWADPAFRATSVQKNIVDLEARYGRFFLSLAAQLPPEQVAAIKQLLATQSTTQAELAFPKAFPESAADTAARLASLDQLQRMHEQQLQSALGEAGYLDLQIARHSEPYRDTVAALANGMRARGVSLDDGRQERMLDAYTAAMLELGAELQRHPDSSTPPANDAERRARRDLQLQRINALLARSMGEVLDRSALEAFLATQRSRESGN